MTTTISPGIGHAPLFTQEGVGATPGYDMVDLRRATNGALQEGVMEPTSYVVTQRAAGVNLSVDIAANATPAGNGVSAYVQGDAVVGQSLYAVPSHTAVINETIAAAHATLPRVDRVVLEVLDNVHDASGLNINRVRVISGTATAGATLDNLTGAAAVPNSCLLLADVHVPAADTTISNAQIRDRRKWARGAFHRIALVPGTDYTTTSSAWALIDSTQLNPRIECSSVPMHLSLSASVKHSVSNALVQFNLGIDSAQQNRGRRWRAASAGGEDVIQVSWDFEPTAGSHRLGPMWATSDPTATLDASVPEVIELVVKEIVRPNAANNTLTTG